MFANRANIPVSKIREILSALPNIKAKREKDDPEHPLIDLSIGDPHIAPNPYVMTKLREMTATRTSLGYTSAQGESETLKSILLLYKKYYPKVEYKNTEVMATVGASGALSTVFSVLGQKDNVFLTFEPYFAAYNSQIKLADSTPVIIPTKNSNFRPTAEKLKQALKAHPNIRALIMNYPNNPSGVALTRQEAVELAEVLEEHLLTHPDFDIIIDDVYRDFNDSEEHVTILDVAPHLKDHCIVINSGAKGLIGAPGERVGMVAAREEIIKRMIGIQTSVISSVPHRTQAGLRFGIECYLQNPNNDWLMSAKKEYRTNVESTFIEFKKQGFTLSKPDGAFYLLVNAKHLIGKINPDTLTEIKNDMDIANYFLHTAGVALVPGSGFGIDPTEGYLRVSCAKENHLLIEAAKRMGKAAQLILNPELQLRLNFYSQLQLIKDKATEFTQIVELLSNAGDHDASIPYAKAEKAATVLHTKLTHEATEYFEGRISKHIFTDNCDAAIKEARLELGKHRGWKQLLGNIALAICLLGVGFLAAGLVNRAVTGNFMFFKTDSGNMLDTIENTIQGTVAASAA